MGDKATQHPKEASEWQTSLQDSCCELQNDGWKSFPPTQKHFHAVNISQNVVRWDSKSLMVSVTWQEGQILVVNKRLSHYGGEVSVLWYCKDMKTKITNFPWSAHMTVTRAPNSSPLWLHAPVRASILLTQFWSEKMALWMWSAGVRDWVTSDAPSGSPSQMELDLTLERTYWMP